MRLKRQLQRRKRRQRWRNRSRLRRLLRKVEGRRDKSLPSFHTDRRGIPKLRDPATGSLMGLGRPSVFKRMHQLRDGITNIKRYLYRRIMARAFEPLKETQFTSEEMNRLAVWLQPVGRSFKHTQTEIYCLNSRSSTKHRQTGLGSPSIFFPTPKRAQSESQIPQFWGIRARILRERRFPGPLLEGLLGKSSNEQPRKPTSAKSRLKSNIWSVLSSHCPLL